MDFSEKEYIGMDLREENWEEQELTGVRFVGCRFHGANMMGLVTRNCWFEDCDFSFARLEDTLAQPLSTVGFMGQICSARYWKNAKAQAAAFPVQCSLDLPCGVEIMPIPSGIGLL